MEDLRTRDANLLVVAAIDGYAARRGLTHYQACVDLRDAGVLDSIRSNYESLHTQSLDEAAAFAEDVMKRTTGGDSAPLSRV